MSFHRDRRRDNHCRLEHPGAPWPGGSEGSDFGTCPRICYREGRSHKFSVRSGSRLIFHIDGQCE
jgi:hypothetical protein